MISPLPLSTITSRYGTLENRSTRHRGLDFGAREGTWILAPSNATVVLNQWSDCLGWCLVIRFWEPELKKPMFLGFAHLKKKSSLLIGKKIKEGSKFALCGNTGSCSRGAHLHLTYGAHARHIFEGATLDPEILLRKYVK